MPHVCKPLHMGLPPTSSFRSLAALIKDYIYGEGKRASMPESLLYLPKAKGGYGLREPRADCLAHLTAFICQILQEQTSLSTMIIDVVRAGLSTFCGSPIAFLLTYHGDSWKNLKGQDTAMYFQSALRVFDELNFDIPANIDWDALTLDEIASVPWYHRYTTWSSLRVGSQQSTKS